MAKRKPKKTHTLVEALREDIAASRPLDIVTKGKDGMFPQNFAVIAGEFVPLAAATEGNAMLDAGDHIGAVQWIATQARAWAARLWEDNPDDDELHDDAARIVKHAADLVWALDNNNIGQAALSGIQLGVYEERLRIREGKYEEDMRRGKRSSGGANKARGKKTAKAEKRAREINKAVADKRRTSSKHRSITAIRRDVAEQLGVDYATVLRAQSPKRKGPKK